MDFRRGGVGSDNDATLNIDSDGIAGSRSLHVGAAENASNGTVLEFDQQIDELRIWGTARTQAEIQTNMNTPVSATATGLQGYWTMDADVGGQIVDQHANGNNLTLGSTTGADNDDPSLVASGAPVRGTSISTNEDTAFNGTLGAFDAEGDTLTFSASVAPTNGTVVINDANAGTFTYTPNADFSGNDAFTAQVTDGNGGTTTQAISLTIAPVNDAPNVAGPQGGALSFDGTDDFASISNQTVHNPGVADFTVETWFLWNGSNTGSKAIVSKQGVNNSNVGYRIQLDGDNLTLLANTSNTNLDANLAHVSKDMSGLAAGWYHVAMVMDSDGTNVGLTGYLNGDTAGFAVTGSDTDASSTLDVDGITGGRALTIGGTPTNGAPQNFFDQKIDDVRLWNTARTQSEIQDNFQSNLTGTENGLVGYWKMDEITGGQVTDSSTNSNALTLGTSTATSESDDPTLVVSDVPFGVTAQQGGAAVPIDFSVSDVDAATGTVTATLSATSGDISLTNTTGLTITGGAQGSGSLIVTGTITDIDNGLASVTYTPDGAPQAASLNLSTLTGTNGFVINGIDAADEAGFSVSGAGDINNDGIDDVIIGARFADPTSNTEGESYVVFGKSSGFGASVDLSSLDGTNGFVINGIDADDRSGRSVSDAGDVNGDGIADIIISGYLGDTNGSQAGESYVVFGASNVGTGGSLNLSSLNGTNGFTLNGINNDDQSGKSVSSAGDVNGDGIDDLIISGKGGDPGDPIRSNAGEAYVVFGNSSGFATTFEISSLLTANGGDGSKGFVLNGVDASDDLSTSVSSAGDVNNDGFDDLIVGAFTAEPSGGDRNGESYLVFGSAAGPGAELEMSSLNGTNGIAFIGVDDLSYSGGSVSSAGDINGDGIDDLIIGAHRETTTNGLSGAAYVVFGSESLSGATFALSSLNGTNGFVLNGATSGDRAGRSVSSAGDINGDGIDDLFVGALYGDPNTNSKAGESYVIYGKTTGFSATFELSTIETGDGSNGIVFNGIDADDQSGYSVSAAGDVNGDGIGDIIIGASDADPGADAKAGEAYVVFGQAPSNANDTLTVTVNDGGNTGGGALSDTETVAITVNDQSVIRNFGETAAIFSIGGNGVLLDRDSDVTVTDADSTNFDTGILTVSVSNNAVAAEDVLQIGTVGNISTAGANIIHSGSTIGTFTGGTSGSNLVVTFNASATATVVQETVRALQYDNSNASAPTTPREVSITLTDGDGATSLAHTVDVAIAPAANVAPTLAGQQVASFDGTGDAIELSNVGGVHNPGTGDYSVELWFFWDGSTGGAKRNLFAHGGDQFDESIHIGITNGGTLQLTAAQGGGNTDANEAMTSQSISGLATGWHHVAMVLDSTGSTTSITGYLNGSVAGFTNAVFADTDGVLTHDADGINLSTSEAHIGGFDNGGTLIREWDDKIDEVRIWNTARSSAEVNANMNKSLNGDESGLLGLWKLDGNANDATANGLNGTLEGNTSFEAQNAATVAALGSSTLLHLATDSNGDAITYTGSSPVNGSITQTSTFANHPEFTYEAGGASSGSYQVTAGDGVNNTAETINITVSGGA